VSELGLPFGICVLLCSETQARQAAVVATLQSANKYTDAAVER
jgi:hypothetical protein